MVNKVEKRRDYKINEAANKNNWDTVLHLLSQPLWNLERKDRQYNLLSFNTSIKSDEHDTEFLDLYQDNTYNALELVLTKERNQYLYKALKKLHKDDLLIFLSIALYNTSALQLTKETQYKSHKTIKIHYEKTCQTLRKELEKYF
ncbi:sigma-70 family RNA polymerase sigma factor [Streptococcus salivarius]